MKNIKKYGEFVNELVFSSGGSGNINVGGVDTSKGFGFGSWFGKKKEKEQQPAEPKPEPKKALPPSKYKIGQKFNVKACDGLTYNGEITELTPMPFSDPTYKITIKWEPTQGSQYIKEPKSFVYYESNIESGVVDISPIDKYSYKQHQDWVKSHPAGK